MPKDEFLKNILRRRYLVSVDNGRALLVNKINDYKLISLSLNGVVDLVWVYDQNGNKIGWMKVNSLSGSIIDYSTGDTRIADIVADGFLGRSKK
jgi:hypothetical protein